MTGQAQQKRGVLYIIVCAAGPARQVQECVVLAQAAGWEVCVIPTPNAVPFLDVPSLTQQTGRSVRSEYRSPDTAETFPPCDALVVVAATFNSINKLALGIADTRALTILSENLGRERPILVVPCVNQNHLARHPALHQSLATLETWGVHILFDLATYPPRNEVPWEVVLEELHHILISS
ncbi:MAG TPA: flavoprotein [Ktedonobacteraceae bacterium]|nr:flavoprotein [Ktedonobacteraceae bacterium]